MLLESVKGFMAITAPPRTVSTSGFVTSVQASAICNGIVVASAGAAVAGAVVGIPPATDVEVGVAGLGVPAPHAAAVTTIAHARPITPMRLKRLREENGSVVFIVSSYAE
jgi:hypothetical protein